MFRSNEMRILIIVKKRPPIPFDDNLFRKDTILGIEKTTASTYCLGTRKELDLICCIGIGTFRRNMSNTYPDKLIMEICFYSLMSNKYLRLYLLREIDYARNITMGNSDFSESVHRQASYESYAFISFCASVVKAIVLYQ